jgi:phospholipase/carboxylesterase
MTLARHNDLSLSYVLNVPSGAPDTQPMPMVIVLHGRGADANDLADLAPHIDIPLHARSARGGYRFIFPNAPKPFEPAPGMSYGFSWFDDWPPEPRSLAASRATLLKFIDEVTARYSPPNGKTVLAGFSQGGLMSIDVGFRTAQPLAGIVVMSGAINDDDIPDLRARREQPILIIHGLQDDVIPIIAARRTRRILEDHGLEPEYHEFAMGHQVNEDSIAVVGRFLRKVMSDEG